MGNPVVGKHISRVEVVCAYQSPDGKMLAEIVDEVQRLETGFAAAQARVAELEASLKGQREGINNHVLSTYMSRIVNARELVDAGPGKASPQDEAIAALADEVQRLENQDCNDTMLASGLALDLYLLAKPYMTEGEMVSRRRGDESGVYAHTGDVEADAALGREVRGMRRGDYLYIDFYFGGWCAIDSRNHHFGGDTPEAALAALHKEADNG